MAKRSKGLRSKSRQILRRTPRDRGMPPVTHTLRAFEEGARVAVRINPAIHGGMPHIRYQGQTGTVAGLQGGAVVVRLNLGNKPKQIVVRPEHLKPVS